jgi:hypothetical protein
MIVLPVDIPQPESINPAPRNAEPEEDAMLYCRVCSMRLGSRKCKLFCDRCGYYMSCSDYY